MQANHNDNNKDVLAEIRQQTRHGEWFAGGQYWDNKYGSNSAMTYGGASGGLLLMQGGLFPIKRVDRSFALVSTDEITGVPVKFENRAVGQTDKDGKLLLTTLNPWQENDISIDPLGLAEDVRIEHVRIMAIPSTASGVLARFPMQKMLMVVFGAVDSSDQYIPAGTAAVLQPGDKYLIVGYDGRMYIESPPPGATITAYTENGECTISLPKDMPKHGYIDIGERKCL